SVYGCCTHWGFWFCFFFQAEVGIRDFHVTGVQTCALPISRHDGLVEPRGAREDPHVVPIRRPHEGPLVIGIERQDPVVPPEGPRSEERRVGKECRYWMSL